MKKMAELLHPEAVRVPYALRDGEGLLCHVSPAHNLNSILATGISPLFARDNTGKSWFCSVDRLVWALAHVSHNHSVAVDSLLIFTTSWQQKFVRCGIKGLFYRREMTIPKAWLLPGEYLEAFEVGDWYGSL